MLSEVRTYGRLLVDLRAHLRERLTERDARLLVRRLLDDRQAAFARVLERGVFANPRSPYLPLFRDAGIEPVEALRLVGERGVEAALAAFCDAGVVG